MFVMLFPGQGSQYPGMAKDLYDRHREVKCLFEEASDLLHRDFATLCFNSSEKELRDVRVTGTALFLASYASFIVLSEVHGLLPVMAAGHSVGEFAALTASGVFSFSDALQIVHERGRMLYSRTVDKPGGMMAVRGLGKEQIKNCFADIGCACVYIACYNSPNQIVIAGSADGMERMKSAIKEKGGRSIPLKTGAAFHTPLMHPVEEQLLNLIEGMPMRSPSFPVISSTTAAPHLFRWNIAPVLSRQVVAPVRWLQTMQTLKGYPLRYIVDMGPGRVLADLTRENGVEVKCFTADTITETDISMLQENRSAKEKVFLPDKEFLDLCLLRIAACKNECLDDTLYEGVVKAFYAYLSWLQNVISEMPLDKSDVLFILKRLQEMFSLKSPSAGQGHFNKLLQLIGLTGYEDEIKRAEDRIRPEYKSRVSSKN